MQLANHQRALAGEADFWEELLSTHPRAPAAFVGKLAEKIVEKRRAVALLALLVDADFEELRANLGRSARTWEGYLVKCRDERHADFRTSASRAEPFFDALAAGETALARSIAVLSLPEWRADDEYEDDFHYARFLHILAGAEGDAAAVLERFVVAAGDSNGARIGVCKSLLSRDQEGFDEAFAALLEERTAEVRHEREVLRIDEVGRRANHAIFVEGLGLLRLAEEAGLVTREEYLLCPALARPRAGRRG